MAATKIIEIKQTVGHALRYISDPEKTENGRNILTCMCSHDPSKAAEDFADITSTGTGQSTILAQHMIISFTPGEITPEKALIVGDKICEKLLGDEYQYYLAVHDDKSHVHIHVVFNNTNLIDGRTFQTLCNQGKVSNRVWNKLRNITDEVCREYGLSVIEHPEKHKGKSHWEWQMNREGLSWKAKLKFEIDEVVKISDSFEDFLSKCAERGILVKYEPTHKIDLKFMLAEQRKHNQRAKFTRAKTLGYFYETAQIKSRIEMRKGTITYTPKTQIRQTPQTENKFIQDAIDRGNMKVASIAKNILTQYGVSLENMRSAAMQAYAQKGKLSAELNHLQTEIEDSKAVLKVLKRYHKVKGIHAELKNLSGRKEKKFREQNSYELQEYKEVSHQLLEWFPDKHLPKVDELEQKISTLMQERNDNHELYKQVSQKSKDLAQAQQNIEEYLKQERNQPQKRKNKGELE